MISYGFFFTAFFVAFAVGQILAFKFRKNRFWDYTDYLWYGLAAVSLFFFVVDANGAAQIRHSERRIDQLESDFDGAIKDYLRAAQMHPNDHRFSKFTYDHLLEFRQSPGFPLEEYIDFFGTRHENVFAFLQTLEVPGRFTEMPSVLTNKFFDTDRMERSQIVIAEIESSSGELQPLNPNLLHFAAYLLAFGVAVRLGKVTAVILRA